MALPWSLRVLGRGGLSTVARIGDPRVSSVGQSLGVQLDKLRCCDTTYQEMQSGSSGKRLRLVAGLEYVREGDTSVVTRLDRLARSTLHDVRISKATVCRYLGQTDQQPATTDAT